MSIDREALKSRVKAMKNVPTLPDVYEKVSRLVENPNKNGFTTVLEKYDIPMDFIINKSNMYNKCRLQKEEAEAGEK